jgi:hypothetical protein
LSELHALDGPDGRVLWTWRGGPETGEDYRDIFGLCLARVEGGRWRVPCVALGDSTACRRLVRLDARGRVTSAQDLTPRDLHTLEAADPDGDGNDELWLTSAEGLQILRPGSEETGTRRPLRAPDGLWYLATSDQPGSVVPAPALGLDDPNGDPIRASMQQPERYDGPWLLDPGDRACRPLWMLRDHDMTVCRSALPVLSTGRYAPPIGTPVRPGLAREDPRWTRPLPWIGPIAHTIGPRGFVVLAALATINVVVPIAILRLAARRRPWGLRLLMAMPVAAAIPLAVLQAREALLPEKIGPMPMAARTGFVLGTVAGLPIVLYAGSAAASPFRTGRQRLALVGSTFVATAIAGAAWLWWDSRRMPPIEYYDRSGGYLIVLAGIYAVGVGLLFAWPLRPILRQIERSQSRPPAQSIDASPSRPTM